MKLLFLGTSAGRPTLSRNVTSMALIDSEANNRFWLFDVGEGTQHRLLQAKLKLSKLSCVFITHLHGDHLYGLPGLLSSRTFYEGVGGLRLFGPPGVKSFVDIALACSETKLNYELEITELQPGQAFEADGHRVTTAALEHRVACIGYRVEERSRPGSLDPALLARCGVAPGPCYGRLKRGEDVVLEDGRTIRAADVVGTPKPGRVIAILGDTRPCAGAEELGRDADLLVHEATLAAGLEEKAAEYGHSTFAQAAETAAKAGASRLVVTHISARYDDEAVEAMVADARRIFPRLDAARDFLELEIPMP